MSPAPSLRERPLHKVLLTCFVSKKSGVLVVQQEGRKKIVILEKGTPKACRSNIKKETLGHMVVELGLVSQQDMDQVLKDCQENDGFPLGSALVKKGLLSQDKLNELLEQQIVERIYDLFTWEDGTIKMQANQPGAVVDEVPMPMNTPTLVLRALIHANKKRTSGPLLARSKALYLISDGPIKPEDFQLSGKETALIRRCDGEQAVDAVLRGNGKSNEEAESFLFALIQLGVMRLTDPAAQKKEGAPLTSSKKRTATPGSLADKVQQRLQDIEGKNFFEILGIEQEAPIDTVRKMYFKLAKEFHPDRLRTIEDAEARKDGELLFAKISEAYNTLMDTNKRHTYLETLALGTDEDASEQAGRIIESEALFQKGRNLVSRGNFLAAKEALEQAIEYHPDEPEYHIYLGWAQFRTAAGAKNRDEMEKGKALIETHKDARPTVEAGYVFLGQIAKLEGQQALAERHFEKATEINPKNTDALRELRLMDMRRGKEKKEGKSLKGLFSRKK